MASPAKAPGPRRYPRSDVRVKAKIYSADSKSELEATLDTANLSLGGIFFQSTFFLKLGQPLMVAFTLPGSDERVIKAKGRVVRVETSERRGRMLTGFAIKFEEYFDRGDALLTAYFLAPQIRSFVDTHLRRHPPNRYKDVREVVTDALCAWELKKVDQDASR